MSESSRSADRPVWSMQPLRVRRIHSWRALRWLALGWRDFTQAPLPGLLHGALVAAAGLLMLWFGWTRFWVLVGAFSGFLLVAPVLSTSLYAISRSLSRGHEPNWITVGRAWWPMDARLLKFGVLLMVQGTAWVLTSSALMYVAGPKDVTSPAEFVRQIVLNPDPGLFEIWLMLGGLMAAPVFASTLVTIPLLMDRPRVGVMQAIATSWRAVATNPVLCSVWASLLMTLTLLGFASMMFLLVFILPVLGHASWHAYRDLVVREGV